MAETAVTLEVGDDSYPGRYNSPQDPSAKGILMVPGAGHGPFGDVFLRFARRAAEDGYHVARFETWPFPADVEEKTSEALAADLDAGVEFLRSKGCTSISVVAKSFGGRVALQQQPTAVDHMVLWAPAVRFGEHEEDPSIRAAELGEIQVPTVLLQGADDEVVSLENSRSIADHLPGGRVVELPDEDHSFLRDHERVIDETLSVLDSLEAETTDAE
jgi:pimeloyl-ACP methyl ester carboxylesterase